MVARESVYASLDGIHEDPPSAAACAMRPAIFNSGAKAVLLDLSTTSSIPHSKPIPRTSRSCWNRAGCRATGVALLPSFLYPPNIPCTKAFSRK